MQMGPTQNTEEQKKTIDYVKGLIHTKQVISFDYANRLLIKSHTDQAMHLQRERAKYEKYLILSKWRRILIRWLSKGLY